jgi:hypothetical protein
VLAGLVIAMWGVILNIQDLLTWFPDYSVIAGVSITAITENDAGMIT